MPGEHIEALSDEQVEWLDGEAWERGLDRETMLSRAVEAYRLLEEVEGEESSVDPAALERRQTSVEDDVEGLLSRVTAVEDDVQTKVEDVRSRVIQVKRETDAKAPAEHDHAELRDAVETASTRSDALAEAVAELDARVEDGFDNFEEVCSYLRDERDVLDRKATQLARAVVDLRARVGELERRASARAAMEELRREAARHGAATPDCGDCGSTVHVGLLDEPTCPHCGVGFVDFEPGRRFFGSTRLVPGDPPALEGKTLDADRSEEPDDFFDDPPAGDDDASPATAEDLTDTPASVGRRDPVDDEDPDGRPTDGRDGRSADGREAQP
ncbi:hypothetical protein ACFO0N_05270 [Halobium salinum]|uniref:CopG family transcriptional regulator n=1 Tax=Halobium salinum TaxID=1364940 RepID=A0ABD5P9F1_9EURY|nr:hypothetical protein [Halobium salinum]